ncbi:MAG: T9SS type A sorting domain-containing protein [Bacteroidales bacterium]|nr:T9SS type A sorting domain-containing protein [Bacteroidales bacterium]
MKTAINIISKILIGAAFLFFSPILKSQTYTMDFSDPTTFSTDPTCSEVTPDHWKVKNDYCTVSTPVLTVTGTGSSINVAYVLRVNQSGNLEYNDTVFVQHSVNGGAPVLDTIFHGDGKAGVFSVTKNYTLASGNTIIFDISGTNNDPNEFWQIKKGDFTIENVTINTPQPIEAGEFNISTVLNYVILEWSTYTETNNDYFTIERSKDCISFEPVITIDGAGNSNELLYYSAVDQDPYQGASYYRLKQTDFDGKYEIVSIKSIRTDTKDVNILTDDNSNSITVYSNYCDLTVKLYDIQGNLIANTRFDSKMFQISNLAHGIYLLTLNNSKLNETKKVVIK